MPRGSLTARLGAGVAHLVSRRRLELCFANYLIALCRQFRLGLTHMNERLSLIVSSRHGYPMKSRQTQSWLRPGKLLARLFLAPDDDRLASLQSIFRFDSAEIWRLGQQRRSRYLAALLHRKSNKTAVDAPDGFSGRTGRSPTADPRDERV